MASRKSIANACQTLKNCRTQEKNERFLPLEVWCCGSPYRFLVRAPERNKYLSQLYIVIALYISVSCWNPNVCKYLSLEYVRTFLRIIACFAPRAQVLERRLSMATYMQCMSDMLLIQRSAKAYYIIHRARVKLTDRTNQLRYVGAAPILRNAGHNPTTS